MNRKIVIQKTDLKKAFGGVNALARLLGVSRQAIWQWPDTISESKSSYFVRLAKENGVDLPFSYED